MVHIPYGVGILAREAKAEVAALPISTECCCSMSRDCALPKSRVVAVPQVTQHLSWDCGLACVLMVLKAVGTTTEEMASLHAKSPTRSVWTVDLAHLLRQFDLAVQFTTLTFGTNPGFAAESFYGKMHEDEIRVAQLFKIVMMRSTKQHWLQAAAAAGIEMQQRSVAAQELQRLLLGGRHLVLALVDKLILEHGLALWPSTTPASCPEVGYKGHYVLLCGYDSETDHFILRDPDPRTAAMGLCSLKSTALDAARKAFGTDEDLLIVTLPDTGR